MEESSVKDREYCILLRTKTQEKAVKDFYLACENKGTQDIWMKAIRAAVIALEEEEEFVNLYLS